MPKVAVKTLEQTRSVEPSAARPGVETCAYFEGETDPIHLRLHRLAPGASLTLGEPRTDLAVYVWEGGVEAGGVRLDARSSAVVEAGGALTLTGGGAGGAVLVFNVQAPAPAKADAGRAHLLPNERVPRTTKMGPREGVGGALHADARRIPCQVWLHENDFAMAGREVGLHSHSEDEVIFVRAGAIRLGNRLYGPGAALFVAADTKYGFSSGPEGLSFVNFRGSSPTYTSADGTRVEDEAELWRKAVGLPEYLSPPRPGAQT